MTGLRAGRFAQPSRLKIFTLVVVNLKLRSWVLFKKMWYILSRSVGTRGAQGHVNTQYCSHPIFDTFLWPCIVKVLPSPVLTVYPTTNKSFQMMHYLNNLKVTRCIRVMEKRNILFHTEAWI